MTVGVADADKIFYSAASGVGNPIVYVGSKTGRDGIHGATMASTDFAEDSEEKRPTVQVGDPFTEKLLIEACLELMASDAIRSEEHTSELQSLMRISYAVFCLKKKKAKVTVIPRRKRHTRH